ncbi:MAG: hypothetical protein M1820_001286 [Bogoriella megaspora]|nr:MAG: hypothetical protein M1820_001286 [Bogoriella megaspora]
MPFGEAKPPSDAPVIQVQVADRRPYHYNVSTGESYRAPIPARVGHTGLVDIGIFKDTLLPSLGLHSSLAIFGWGVGRFTNRLETKDWLWPSSFLLNAWWSSVGRRIVQSRMPVSSAINSLSWSERILLTGVTLWSGRLFYRIATRSVARGSDDPRYDAKKRAPEFDWNQQLIRTYLPEALFQTIISLPFTAPFRHEGMALTGYHPLVQALAVGVFGVGFGLEVLADAQISKHREQKKNNDLYKEGVWSIVRHPNYLGDALIHLSFPLLLFGSDMLAPLELLGPLVNYLFLRFVGGDAELEPDQTRRYSVVAPTKMAQLDQYRQEKNSFWPAISELRNQWTWVVLGCGALAVGLEQGARRLLH